MRTYHLLIEGEVERRRITFAAESPDHALHIAEREADCTSAELWDGEMLLARLTKAAPNLWKLHSCLPAVARHSPWSRAAPDQARPPMPGAASGIEE